MRDKKEFVKNIYYMLSYAFKDLQLKKRNNVDAEDFNNIHNLFASILAKGIGWQLKHGLNREYVAHTEDIPCIKGRIFMPGTIRNMVARKQLITCEFDELSENNLLNQVLKTTAMLLLSSPDVEPKYKEALKKEILFFANVDTILQPKSIRWSSINFYQGNQTYRFLMAVCQLIIEGMLLTTENGEFHLANFLDESSIEKLYEGFIREFYKRECHQIKVGAPQIKWALDQENQTTDLLPRMMSDIVLTHDGKTLIIDAKFKFKTTQKSRYGSNTLHSHNLYQIFSYVKNEACNTKNQVYGMLLYAATDDGMILDHKYQMSGNQIWVKTLDLYRKFKDISQDLKQIVIDHFGEPEMKVNFNKLTELYIKKQIDISKCLNKVNLEYRHLSPAIYLYNKIISYTGNKFSNEFIELLYVTLDAWNMNSRAAKLSEFSDFKNSILDNQTLFKKLENLNIRNIESAFDTLKDLYNKLNLVSTNSKLVTFTKTLHFILPELVVPIDRKYTLNFFDVNNYQLTNNQYEVFEGIHRGFSDFANAVSSSEKGLSSYIKNSKDGLTWLTSEAKLIDNIVIGYQKLLTEKNKN